MVEDLIKRIRRDVAVWEAGDDLQSSQPMIDAANLIEHQGARLTALESERDALLAAAGKEAVPAVTTNGKPASQYFRAGRGQGLQEAMLACKREHLEEPAATADDIAYTAAVDDCIKAISRLIGTAPTAALENGGGRDAWQPIDTAPKDGTEVLLIATRHSMLMPHPEMIVGAYRQGWWSGPSTLSHVTHWQPLPAPPTALSQKAGEQQ